MRRNVCAVCGEATDAPFGMCADCVRATTAAECETQGLPLIVDDPLIYDRLGGLFRSAAAVPSSTTDARSGLGRQSAARTVGQERPDPQGKRGSARSIHTPRRPSSAGAQGARRMGATGESSHGRH